MFDKHKEDIRTALDVHTAAGVIVVNKKLDGLGVHLTQMVKKMEGLFQGLDPHERDMQKFIHNSGGAEEWIKELQHRGGEGCGQGLQGEHDELPPELMAQLTDMITATGEHVIDVLSGAARSAKILDGGDWKECVDTHTFVVTMQSYYHEKFNASDTAAPDPSSSVPSPREAEDDRWTLNHIHAALIVKEPHWHFTCCAHDARKCEKAEWCQVELE
ncbi:hypothetical protein B0H14DRAFT_2576011 [Mycena olivaceomarginata]|nr:hypothetical protein B0H14DRAFT_2576011 [Mycena olivaceomarginata]